MINRAHTAGKIIPFVAFVFLSSGVPFIQAITKDEIAKIAGFPESEIRIKNYAHKANRDPDIFWAIDIKSDGGKFFRPFMIFVGKPGSFLGEAKRVEFANFLADPAIRGNEGQMREFAFDQGYGVVGVPAFGPDGNSYSAFASLSNHDVDIKITLRMSSDSPNLVETDWNRNYVVKDEEGIGISGFLENTIRGLGSMELGKLASFEESEIPAQKAEVEIRRVEIRDHRKNEASPSIDPSSRSTDASASEESSRMAWIPASLTAFFALFSIVYFTFKRFRNSE